MKTPFAEMLRYNEWANRVLFEACRGLSDEQLATHAPGTSTSVRELLTHIAIGQQTIAVRAMGGQQSSWGVWPGFDALIELTERSSDTLMSIADRLDEDIPIDLERAGKVYRSSTSFFFVQALAHGVEHRTEIKVALESIGVVTPDLDSWSCIAAAGSVRDT